MTASKSANDIRGFEFDWLGSDIDGCVALFSTAGGGYAPKAFLRDTDLHYRAIESVLGLPVSTAAELAPELAPGFVNTWRLVAERGLYAYDSDPNGGPYRLVAAPAVPARIDSLPPVVAEAVVGLGFAWGFRTRALVTAEMLRAGERRPGTR